MFEGSQRLPGGRGQGKCLRDGMFAWVGAVADEACQPAAG